MNTIRLRYLTLVVTLAAVIFLSGCGGNTKEQERQRREAEDMVYAAYLDKDYPRIIELVDSFKPQGCFSEGKACYWLGYAYDRMMQKRMAELYWKTGIAAVENSTDDEDVRVYAGITNRLTGLLSTWTEFAIPATERLKSLGRDTTSEYTNMLIYIGCSQSRLGLSDDKTDNRLEEAYRAHLNNINNHPDAINYRDAIVGVINISYNYLEIADYKKAVLWLERLNQLIDGYEKQADARPDYSNKQRARYNIYLARALEGMGRKDEAAEAYRLFCQTDFFQTAEGKILASDYLRLAGRWQDAADNFGSLDEMMKEFGTSYSLENIQKMLLKKYEVNKKAGRIDTARAVSLSITERLDSAITLSRIAEAREEAAVHQKELEMTAENERYVRQRHIGRVIGMAATILFLLVYIIVRHRMGVRLRKAHNDLKTAYDQLEETTSAKERMESELRIARDIQMSMVPSVFPNVDGLDMYASMTPAKEVGGDLYNFLWKGDMLYFCIGDVSGKGVPASVHLHVRPKTRTDRVLQCRAQSSRHRQCRGAIRLPRCQGGQCPYRTMARPGICRRRDGLAQRRYNAALHRRPERSREPPAGTVWRRPYHPVDDVARFSKYARHHRGPQGRHRPVPRRRRAERRPHHARLPHHQQTIELIQCKKK